MKITLNEKQTKTLEIIKKQRHYGVFFDMSVGKTALILSLIEYIAFDKLEKLRTLVIAPANVANELTVWQDEIEKWENYRYFDYINYSGTEKKRIKLVESNSKGSIAIMSDALLDWWFKKYGNLDMFDMIVIDESSRFKSHKTVRFKRLAKMIDLKKHRVYLLSGTPTPNGWEGIWSQMYLLDKGERLGKSFWGFIDRYFIPFKYRNYLPVENKKIILDLIKDICIFADSKGIKIPPKKEIKIFLKLPQEKKKQFDSFKRNYILEFSNKEVTALSKQILINKCLQLSNGCVYYDKFGNFQVFDNTKLNFVKEYSEEHPEENILVFYPFKFDKKRLLELPGAEEIIDRKSKDKWNSGKIKLGIISPFSFQFGGNLQTGGYTIIWFGLVWALEAYLQGNKRLHRQGQKHEVKILYLLTEDTWDDYVYQCVVSKEKSQNEFLDYLNINKLKEKEI